MDQIQQQKPWKPDSFPKQAQGNNHKGRRIIGTFVTALLIVGIVNVLTSCSQVPTNSTTQVTPPISPVQPTPPTFLAEQLTFQGDISGTLAAGTNPQPINHSSPILGQEYPISPNGNYIYAVPTSTQCTDFESAAFTGSPYIAAIVGDVGPLRYVVTIKINKDNQAYMKPGTPLKTLESNQGVVEIYEEGGQNREWEQVVGPAGQEAVIVLHSDRVSGTVDVWLAASDEEADSDEASEAESTLHLQGDWRCG